MLWCVGWLPTGSSHTRPADPPRLSSARPAGFGLATGCLEVEGNTCGIVLEVGFICLLTRHRSGWAGMVATLLRISEIPRCRSLEFPRGRAVRRAWVELTGLSSSGLLSGQLGDGGGHVLATARRVASARARWDRIR